MARHSFAFGPSTYQSEAQRRNDEAMRRMVQGRIDTLLAAPAFDSDAAHDLAHRATFAVATRYLLRVVKSPSLSLVAFLFAPSSVEFAPNRAAQIFSIAVTARQKINEILFADDLRAIAAGCDQRAELAGCALAACGLGAPWSDASHRVRAVMLLRELVITLRERAS